MSKWPLTPLASVIQSRKEFIQIDDLADYKRCRVQLHAQGIVLRDIVPGAEIKTKKQQVCKAGDFLVAEIDAKVGGFGIVPEELDQAIVSSHYFLFGIDQAKLDRRFLDFYIRTPAFREQVAAQGSTNYAAIRPNDVLVYKIPLPPLPEQRRIVARIESLSAKIEEARRLRRQISLQSAALVASVHAELSSNRTRTLSELLKLDEDQVVVSATSQYPQVGVKSFGGGLFRKSAIAGIETTYKAFNRLYDGALVLSQVKAWEGAIAVCGRDLAGWFVSPEYRTFRCISGESLPGYMSALVRTEWFWSKLSNATRGVGARRERTRPEQFLALELSMPTVELQQKGEALFTHLDAIQPLQSETADELAALLPSILDKAFKGEL